MPFRIQALQVDGGSEFAAAFEAACQQRGLRLFVLPPRSPKLNGAVERAQRTHTEAFYEVTGCTRELPAVNRALQAWEHISNTVRPHQALGSLTPQQFLRQQRARREQTPCHQSTGTRYTFLTPGAEPAIESCSTGVEALASARWF